MPTLVEDDGQPIAGETALRRLEKEIVRSDAAIDPRLPDPTRYPAVSVRPSKAWVSQVGGTWAHAWTTTP